MSYTADIQTIFKALDLTPPSASPTGLGVVA